MMEKLDLGSLGEIGFRIARLTRLNLYSDIQRFKTFSGDNYEAFIREIHEALSLTYEPEENDTTLNK